MEGGGLVAVGEVPGEAGMMAMSAQFQNCSIRGELTVVRDGESCDRSSMARASGWWCLGQGMATTLPC